MHLNSVEIKLLKLKLLNSQQQCRLTPAISFAPLKALNPIHKSLMTTTTIAPTSFNTTDLSQAQLQQLQDLIQTKQLWNFVSESIHQGLHNFAKTFSDDTDTVCDITDQLEELVAFDGIRIEGLLSTTTAPKTFVSELLQLAANGDCDTSDMNTDVFNKAVELMRERADDDNPISDFEDVLPFLKANGCDGRAIFGCDVTEETTDALVAYLCYCI